MKKIITTVFCTAIALCSGLNVYAAEILERDYICLLYTSDAADE